MPNIPVDGCCGCTACANICPVNAIRMTADREGFLYPQIDEHKCISCSQCENVCPVLNPPVISDAYTGVVVAQSMRPDALRECTSGGFVDALNYYATEVKKGFAVGVAFDDDFMPVHTIADTYEKAKAFRNSKYAQSNLGDIFPKITQLLDQGDFVVFTGTPCQVAGLNAFLRKPYDNLLTVDLVCRSVPSPRFWREYLKWQEKKHKQKILSVACRRKTYGYHSGALEIRFDQGKKYAGSNRVDYFMKAFHKDICSRPSCYGCAFKNRHRCSDFTVFDSWCPEQVTCEAMKDNDRGYSNVIAHTEKALGTLEKVENIKTIPADAEKMFQFTGGMEQYSVSRPAVRDVFYASLEECGFEKTVTKYVSVSGKDRLIEAAKPIWFGLKRMLKGY